MNEKFNKNTKVKKFTTMLGIAVRLIVIDPFSRKFIINHNKIPEKKGNSFRLVV